METPPRISFEEYERLEALDESRLEYHDGAVVRMESPSLQHETIITNIGDLLATGVGRTGCRKFTNATVVTRERQYGFRPDLAVSCDAVDLGPGDHQRACRLRSPSLLVEVLSRSTATLDLGDKALAYARISSLFTYLVVDCRRRWVACYRRDRLSEPMTMHEVVDVLETPYGRLALDEIYADVGVAQLSPID